MLKWAKSNQTDWGHKPKPSLFKDRLLSASLDRTIDQLTLRSLAFSSPINQLPNLLHHTSSNMTIQEEKYMEWRRYGHK